MTPRQNGHSSLVGDDRQRLEQGLVWTRTSASAGARWSPRPRTKLTDLGLLR